MKDRKQNFQLEIGDVRNLKGNAVVYWNLKAGKEPAEGAIRILAVNFVISVFTLDDNLVTATFPPVGFEDREDFMLYIRQSQCDLIYAGEFSMEKEAGSLKNLPDNEYYLLNRILNDYLECYRERVDNVILNLSLKEKIYLLKKFIKNYRHSLNRKKVIQVPISLNRIRNLIVDLKKKFNPFDLENLYEVIAITGSTVDKMIDLYMDKFVSIYYEDYEKAAQLTEQIEKYREKLENLKS